MAGGQILSRIINKLPIQKCWFLPDTDFVVTIDYETVNIWDIRKGEIVARFFLENEIYFELPGPHTLKRESVAYHGESIGIGDSVGNFSILKVEGLK